MATNVNLGNACPFAVLGASTVTNTGPTVVNGDLGLYPGTAITGFFGTVENDGPGIVNGAIHQTDAVAQAAQSDLVLAYNQAASLPPTANLTGQDLGGMTLPPGVYKFDTSAQLTGILTLDGFGDYVFQIGSTLTTAAGSSIVLINGATANQVYWQVGTSATLGTTTDFKGNILALASITANTGATVQGNLLARNGAVTLDTNTITSNGCPLACPLITVNPPTLPNGTVGDAYNQTITASSLPSAPPFTFAVTSGLLPNGLVLASGGQLSGTPTTAGTFTFTITATDANGCQGTREFTIIIDQADCPLITLTPASLPNGIVGDAYNQDIDAVGGVPPHTFALTNGSLPNGLVLNPVNGVISGIAATAGIFTFTITTTDSNGCQGSQVYTITILQADCPIIVLSPVSLIATVTGSTSNETITASPAPSGTYSFLVTSGLLPPGVILNPLTGQLSGPVLALAGNYNFVITATDSSTLCQGSRSYLIVVVDGCPLITLLPITLPNGTVARTYTATITAPAAFLPVTFMVTSGSLPPGLTLSASGIITGRPRTAGTFTFSITATDINTCTGTQGFVIVIARARRIAGKGVGFSPAPDQICCGDLNKNNNVNGDCCPDNLKGVANERVSCYGYVYVFSHKDERGFCYTRTYQRTN